MAIRMKDIARDLGVSVMTVSKALRNHSDIGAETRARVLRRIEELGYQPNRAARALVTGRSGAIGLVVPELVHPFFAEVARGLTRTLRGHAYSLVISASEDDPALERHEIDQLLAQRVDALVVATVEREPGALRRIEAHEVPLVLIDRRIPDLRAPFVGVDDVEVGFLATDHLARIGCRRIGHIGGADVSVGRGRLEGYRKALASHGLPEPRGGVVSARAPNVDGQRSGEEAMRALLAVRPALDGVFCFNDPVALGALEAARVAGVRVPEDVAVAGVANLFYDDLLRVPLTSVDQGAAEMGERAASMALDLIAGKRPPRRVVLLPPRLVARASTARRPG